MERVTILKLAKRLLITTNTDFMCVCIKSILQDNGFIYGEIDIEQMFPEFNIQTAKEKFNALKESKRIGDPWWRINNKKDRIAYFDYLIEFYKNDKTDIKRMFKKWLRKI